MPPTPVVTVRNLTNTNVVLTAEDGTFITLAPNAQSVIDSKFTYFYDPTKVQIVSGIPIQGGGGTTGGSYPTTVPPYSAVVTQANVNEFAIVTFGENTVLARIGNGPIEAVPISTIAAIATASLTTTPRANLTTGSMTLYADLGQIPDVARGLIVFVNGIVLYESDYTVAGSTIVATTSLNERFGGAGNDGNGFADSDECFVQFYPQI